MLRLPVHGLAELHEVGEDGLLSALPCHLRRLHDRPPLHPCQLWIVCPENAKHAICSKAANASALQTSGITNFPQSVTPCNSSHISELLFPEWCKQTRTEQRSRCHGNMIAFEQGALAQPYADALPTTRFRPFSQLRRQPPELNNCAS